MVGSDDQWFRIMFDSYGLTLGFSLASFDVIQIHKKRGQPCTVHEPRTGPRTVGAKVPMGSEVFPGLGRCQVELESWEYNGIS